MWNMLFKCRHEESDVHKNTRIAIGLLIAFRAKLILLQCEYIVIRASWQTHRKLNVELRLINILARCNFLTVVDIVHQKV